MSVTDKICFYCTLLIFKIGLFNCTESTYVMLRTTCDFFYVKIILKNEDLFQLYLIFWEEDVYQ